MTLFFHPVPGVFVDIILVLIGLSSLSLSTGFSGKFPTFVPSSQQQQQQRQRPPPPPPQHHRRRVFGARHTSTTTTSTQRFLFDNLGKIFEEEGSLGKGITVGKVQVALQASDRSSSSIFGLLEQKASSKNNSSAQLSRLASEVCLALLRKSDDWTAACSDFQWFGEKDASKAERTFNAWSDKEASKFEKEYIPGPGSEEKGGGPSLVVVSIVLEIQGDETKFDGAGFSLAGTKDVLTSIASDVKVDGGTCLNAVEVFWTPGDRDEVLSFRDVVVDFPELIDL